MRDLAKQEDLVAEVSTRGGEVRVIQLDVTGRQSIEAAIECIEREQGRLHAVVNNAGYGIGGFFEELSETEIREQFDTNFAGPRRSPGQPYPCCAAQPRKASIAPR